MFHVPESFRLLTGPHASNSTYGNNGVFAPFTCCPGRLLWTMASDGEEWEHVSVHAENPSGRKTFLPNWEEMCHIKHLFWDAEDCVMQLHPPQSDWGNTHSHVLHLWRPIGQEIPHPPSLLVGIVGIRATEGML